jgi:hypothetical protein
LCNTIHKEPIIFQLRDMNRSYEIFWPHRRIFSPIYPTCSIYTVPYVMLYVVCVLDNDDVAQVKMLPREKGCKYYYFIFIFYLIFSCWVYIHISRERCCCVCTAFFYSFFFLWWSFSFFCLPAADIGRRRWEIHFDVPHKLCSINMWPSQRIYILFCCCICLTERTARTKVQSNL